MMIVRKTLNTSTTTIAIAGRRTASSSFSKLVILTQVFGLFCMVHSFRVLQSSSRGIDSLKMSPRNIVVIGGGIQGASVAYHLSERLRSSESADNRTTKVTILESIRPGSAASGKGGGFMARSWGDGTPTQRLHEVSFDLYETIAPKIGCTSYRKLPVLSVSAGSSKNKRALEAARQQYSFVPSWLDGESVGRISALGHGSDTAQVTPSEFVEKMLEDCRETVAVVLGTCVGIEITSSESSGSQSVTGVQYTVSGGASPATVSTIPADTVVVCAGPWSCAAEDWFRSGSADLKLPMEGIKSTSIVWKKPANVDAIDATALFCGEDSRYGTHLEVYPRSDGTVYICGIGGSDYITTSELKKGAFREQCDANPKRVSAAVQAFQDMSSVYRTKDSTGGGDVGQLLEKTQACMRPCPPDAMPYMGQIPNIDGAYINAGHNCWGIAWAPACGKAMAELILDGECTLLDLKPFDPARFTPAAQKGLRGRKKQGINVGEQW